MPTLFSWYLKAHGSALLAHGIVSGHPKLPDGMQVHTSAIVRIAEEERGILLETQSGSLYHLRSEELGRKASSLPAPELPGLPSEFWQYCARAREQADRDREAALSTLNVSGVLCLRVAGPTVLSALWAGRSGPVRRVEPYVHYGMFQDSVLIQDFVEDAAGVCRVDFRYFPYRNRIEPYKISEDVKTILIVNEGAQDVAFGYGENKLSCAAGAATEIDTAPWRRETL
ncbi:MAG: hypothetical protein HDT33_01645 [Clostridiales bacterium]|nr:hypothetical protein [Clostridiales bacterium]